MRDARGCHATQAWLLPDRTKGRKTMVTRDEALHELNREKRMREMCYDRWISEGKLSMIDARDRMLRLCAAIALLTPQEAGSEVVSS
jgi:hypothetical protein